MARTEEQIEIWRAAWLIDAETAGRIRAFEAAQMTTQDSPTLTEAIVYLGLAVIGVGVVILVGANWDRLAAWAHVATPLIPGLLALVTAFIMRRMQEPGLRRGAHVAALLGGALLTVTVATTGREVGWTSETTLLAAGCAAVLATAVLWILWPSHLLLLGLSAGSVLFSVGIGANAPTHDVSVGAMTATLLGAVGILLAEQGTLRPRVSARAFAAVGFAGGAYLAGVEGSDPAWTEALVFIAGALLIVLSIRRGTMAYMACAVGAMFLALITSVVRHVQDPTLAALSLMLVGGAVIAVVLVLIRLKPWVPPAAAH